MHDRYINAARLITAALWVLAGSLYAAAWIVSLFNWRTAVMLGFTGTLFSCLAGVSQVRCYSLRVCGLMRATAGLEAPSPEVRLLR